MPMSEPGEEVANSPFVELGCPFTICEALKMALLLPLVPIRFVVGGLALVAVAVINTLAAWNWPLDKPLTPWRRRLILLSKELVFVTLWCVGFRIRVRGRENIQVAERLGAVGVFNHVSWVDAFVLVWLMAPSGVSKESNSRLPVIGQAVRALQTVFIPYSKLSTQRGGHSGATAAAAAAAAVSEVTADRHSGATAAAAAAAAASEVTADRHSGATAAAAAGGDIRGQPSGGSGCSAGSSSSSCYGSDSDGGKSTGSSGACSAIDGSGSSSRSVQAATHPVQLSGALKGGRALQSPPLPPPPPKQAAAVAGGVVTSNVTHVLLRRVNHPSYCKHGGYPMVAMAPEGTTGNGRCLLNFRTGAFVLRRPVLPICLRYRWRGVSPAWTLANERWQFLRLMCQFRNDLEVDILPPFKPSQDELKDPRLFACHVRRQMAAVLEVPLVDASHDDYLELRRRGVSVSWDGRRITTSPSTNAAA